MVFPHCDASILHPPGSCTYCDLHPEWQELRQIWGINFTGQSDPKKAPCPSERIRTVAQAHQWAGNRPTEGLDWQPGPEPKSAVDRLLSDEES